MRACHFGGPLAEPALVICPLPGHFQVFGDFPFTLSFRTKGYICRDAHKTDRGARSLITKKGFLRARRARYDTQFSRYDDVSFVASLIFIYFILVFGEVCSSPKDV